MVLGICSAAAIAIALCGCRPDQPRGDFSAVPAGEVNEAPKEASSPAPPRSRRSTAPDDSRQLPARDDQQIAGGETPPPATVTPQGDAPHLTPAQPTFRPPDTRPRHDDVRLASVGIRAYESRHLKLYTDIEPEIARTLPPLIDAAYPEWTAYFGPLPPDRQGAPFQMTGYLMRDQALFREAGLLPEDLRSFSHGRHRGAEFWMNDQEHEYYRRHLVIHEATHCFMTILQDPPNWPAPWYMEGMAEHFGTHRVVGPSNDAASTGPVLVAGSAEDGIEFRLMPDQPENFAGHGRITLIQNATREGRAKTLDQVLSLRGNDYLNNESYAWSWALCLWLDRHPRYQERFRELGQHLSRRALARAFARLFGEDLPNLRMEWMVFIHSLQYGYQFEQAAMVLADGRPLYEGAERTARVMADRGWQSSGVHVQGGTAYELLASGRFTLADDPKPWISEAQGISFRYFRGRPLGQLLGAVHEEGDTTGRSLLEVFSLGRHHRFVPASSGTLYLRLNDSWSELSENTGHIDLQVRAVPSASDKARRVGDGGG